VGGRRRPIVDFGANDKAPTNVAFLFDTSGSMYSRLNGAALSYPTRTTALPLLWANLLLVTIDGQFRDRRVAAPERSSANRPFLRPSESQIRAHGLEGLFSWKREVH
jgi:hypothetical protein